MSTDKISENLRKFRSEKKLSLEKVAHRAGLSLNTVVKIEHGSNKNPTIGSLIKIANALGKAVDELIK